MDQRLTDLLSRLMMLHRRLDTRGKACCRSRRLLEGQVLVLSLHLDPGPGLDPHSVSLGSHLHLVLQSGFPHCLLFCHQFFLLLKNLLLSSLILYRLIFIPSPGKLILMLHLPLVILGLRLHIVSSLLSLLLIGKDSW